MSLAMVHHFPRIRFLVLYHCMVVSKMMMVLPLDLSPRDVSVFKRFALHGLGTSNVDGLPPMITFVS